MELKYRGLAYQRPAPSIAQDNSDRPSMSPSRVSDSVTIGPYLGKYRGCEFVLQAGRSMLAAGLAAWPWPRSVVLKYRGLAYGPGYDRPLPPDATPTSAQPNAAHSANHAVDRLAKTISRDRQATPARPLPADPWPQGQAPPSRSTLYPGQRGDRVAVLQAALQRQGLLRAPYQPGYYGPLTDRAVRKLQRAWGVPITGIADARVWRWVEGNPQRPSPPPRPTVAPIRPDRPLQTGDRGPWVAELQARLRCRGYFDHRITGHFDATTTTALHQFQGDRGLAPTGQADATTWAALAQRNPATNTTARSIALHPQPLG